jgi:hypothetical protein
VRSGGKWHLGLLRESPEVASLQELAWLVGNWSYSSDGAETRMVVEWTEGKKYLPCRTTNKQGGETTTATQILVVHPATGAIQSWTFESDGSLGEAVWSRTDKGWTAKVTSVTADGDKVTATTTLTPIGENTFTFLPTERTVDGEKAADVGPIQRKLRRRVGPERAGHFGLRAHVELTEARPQPVAGGRSLVEKEIRPRIEPHGTITPTERFPSVRQG